MLIQDQQPLQMNLFSFLLFVGNFKRWKKTKNGKAKPFLTKLKSANYKLMSVCYHLQSLIYS